jgi:pilus assembly protein Flp/PilA
MSGQYGVALTMDRSIESNIISRYCLLDCGCSCSSQPDAGAEVVDLAGSRRRCRTGINLEFYSVKDQFAADINFSRLASPLSKLVHQEIEMTVLASLLKDESGVTAIEYTLIAALIAVAAVGSFTLIGTDLSSTFGTIAGKL